jgi:two-component system chemotaxis sensor kinase CheA
MIVGVGQRAVAITCDVVLGDQEIVLKGLGRLLARAPGYLGATILDDGGIALVLDPNHVVRAHSAAAVVVGAAAAPGRPAASKVLVVDDQYTVREMQRSILETAGYEVETARDGREALTRVTGDAGIDMVLTDVQMPEMDGFALLRAIRALPDRASLPVAIVTSVDGEEDRRRGIEEGADAYIVKQQFDQQTLLDIVGSLVRP